MDLKKKYEDAKKAYVARTPKAQSVYRRARNSMPGGETRVAAYINPHPLFIERAKGCEMWDLDGNKYLDFLNNYTSLIHGHAHPEVEKSIVEALSRGTCLTAVLQEQVEFAELLCERVPSVDSIRFCNSGTEATMSAVRTARAYTGRQKIMKMEGGYHGSTDMMKYNVDPGLPKEGQTYNTESIPDSLGVSKKVGEDLVFAPFNNLEIVEDILKEQASEIAAIIVEPVLGATGFIPPKPGYLQGLRDLCDKYNVLLVFDEVQTLRLAEGGAQEFYGVIPDITAMGKIIGGGLPVGAFGGKKEYMDMYDAVNSKSGKYIFHSGTFNGARPVMAGGITTMKLYDEDIINNLHRISDKLVNSIKTSINKYNLPFSMTHVGSFMQIHFTEEEPYNYVTVKSPYGDELASYFQMEMLNRGIYIAPRGSWALSTVTTEEDIALAAKAVDEVLYEIKSVI